MSNEETQNICPFAKNLKRWREAQKLTQRQAAELIGVKESLFRAWEKGRSVPNYADLGAVRVATGISADELLGFVPMGASARLHLEADLPGLADNLEHAMSAIKATTSRVKKLSPGARRVKEDKPTSKKKVETKVRKEKANRKGGKKRKA